MEQFVRDRITQLRIAKGVSEYQMSYDLGHSGGYINNISSGKSMPSMIEFFAICDYFEITPQDFFDTKHDHPEIIAPIIKEIESLADDDISILQPLVRRLSKK